MVTVFEEKKQITQTYMKIKHLTEVLYRNIKNIIWVMNCTLSCCSSERGSILYTETSCTTYYNKD
ncbi:hypothetical protein PFUGPA_01371 [Plasmodium falciparum Palo Alto/Uganda]|uniref:Uncharacterized protein n=2 Tax=Plasmodium falciparum TaxID=5833 RepID=W4J4M7_PLAFP|nr:hypothetical protein PFMALIP_02850 [Plasmodium falciparum MaliPS096_E11]ETW56581.1 hypothetical protein PFUGPA_01371 [Plasmodium falciparum Palo Alto/Uganda]